MWEGLQLDFATWRRKCAGSTSQAPRKIPPSA
jgi:hypothetical protein